MKKEITEKEAENTDLVLEDLLSFKESPYLKAIMFFGKYNISDQRAEFICEKLNILKVVELEYDNFKKPSITFNKNSIEKFLAKGGMTDIWLEKESKRMNIQLSKETLKQFPFTRKLAIGSAIISGCLLLKELYMLWCKTS